MSRRAVAAGLLGFAAFGLGLLQRRRNLARYRARRARRAAAGRHGPSSWASTLARRLDSGELEALFLQEERLWRDMGDELAKSPSASRLERHALLTLGDDDGARGGPPALRSITFGGGGFRTISYLGQIMYLERHGLIDERTRFFGCSLGAYFAVGYALSGREKRPGSLRERFVAATLDFVADVHFDWLGMWGLCGVVFEDILRANLPDDAAARARGVAHVGVTRFGLPWPLGRGLARAELVSDFRDNDDLVSALIASQFIPGWTHGPWCAPVLFRGAPACDGGLLDNQPSPPEHGYPRYSFVRFDEHLRPPALDEPRGHYMCREEHAPLAQVFRPPPCAFGRVEERLVDELRRGYRAAEAAVTAARSRELAPPPTAALPASASAA